jgi:eukaryotic-like serine/threonine-protein kinase
MVCPMVPPADAPTVTRSGDLPSRLRAYRVLRRLATGGTSDILLACAEGPGGFERVVVLKVLLRQFRHDGRFEQMFLREAAAYARLSHPAIVRLYDFFGERDRLVLVLEYVDGLPLSRVQALLRGAGGRLDDAASLFVAWRLFSALAAAHSAKDPLTGEFGPVIHRDVNPSNVLVPWDGHVKLVDFGVAKVSGLDRDAPRGLLKGTHGYVAPEQARGEEVTVRADVYVGCLLLWELLAGRKAIVRAARFEGDIDLGTSAPSFPALATLRPDLPRVLLDAVACGLGTNPDGRGLTADDVSNVLRAVADLDEGRRSLIETLAALRSPAAEEQPVGTTSHTQAVITPVTSSAADRKVPSHRPVSLSGHVPAQGVGAALWVVAGLLALALGLVLGLRPRPHAPPSFGAPAAPAAAPADTAPMPLASPNPRVNAASPAQASPADAHESTSGTIAVPGSRAGHRVWIDERLVGEAPGRYGVSCGAHSIRVGSQGDVQRVNVACDSEVLVR